MLYRLDEAFSEVDEDATGYGGGRSPPIRHDAGRLGARPRHLGKDRIKASFVAAKYERLTQIKATYDPDNVFRSNVNIPPAS
ncbi:MAG: BBE domain-containing protein [Geodermatophilaceae bacterium]|nr:BBE domain-containing protein [Geodermatophilaceae bacterium]